MRKFYYITNDFKTVVGRLKSMAVEYYAIIRLFVV